MKFLLIKAGHIGDVLLMTPALRLLREKFPDAGIDVAVRRGTQGVLEANPDIDHLFLLPRPEKDTRTWREEGIDFLRLLAGTTARRYDWAFDFSGSDRARLHMRLSSARKRCAVNGYGELKDKASFYNCISTFAWAREHQVRKDARLVCDALQLDAAPGPLVMNTADLPREVLARKFDFLRTEKPIACIHATSRWAFKQWLPERWAAVADHLAIERAMQVVFTCGPSRREQEEVDAILRHARQPHATMRGQATLRELAALYRCAVLFCGVDTVAMHIAAAAQMPTVALFGPSSEWSWSPWQTRHALAIGPCSCKQTRKFICDKSQPYPCMKAITVEEVLQKVAGIL